MTGLSNINGLKQIKYINKLLTKTHVIISFSIKLGYKFLYLTVAWNALDGILGVFSTVCINYKCRYIRQANIAGSRKCKTKKRFNVKLPTIEEP